LPLATIGTQEFVSKELIYARLHEEGGDECGDDRQDEVADLLGGNVLEESHNDIIISIDTFYKCLRILGFWDLT
jgi:hypothetical protein